ncbi:hypothetical protein J2Z21_006015 [Streptomyces griseochromogenes]|uniref:Uncharacterized protein n=1 Tax=Streptomyces griseochromogenes TaxID=68214 RepID=A0A1B1ASK1_9ACTN|nr:hypothetical protein [Streptomyces griseochromogenes]ANP49534.1 hypothetical protein AVL59_07875 [Streptomyces griseochromogenes]MBP2053024.1 hypothetical protein [Streptomyces griseochromogenes]
MVTTPTVLSDFMIKLPPTAHVRVAEFTHGSPDLDAARLTATPTHYEHVTGHRPTITLHHAELGATPFGDEALNGIWCARPPVFTSPEDALGALRVFHRSLMGHGLLCLDAGHPDWQGIGTADDVLTALGETGFSFVRVRDEQGHRRVLAVKKLRCCESGRPFHDRRTVLREFR